MADPVSAAMFTKALEEIETIECDLCGEIVATDEQESGTCHGCCEREHERQERYR